MLYLCKEFFNRNIFFKIKQRSTLAKKELPLQTTVRRNTALSNFQVVCNDIFLFSLFPFECTPNRHGFNGNFYFFSGSTPLSEQPAR